MTSLHSAHIFVISAQEFVCLKERAFPVAEQLWQVDEILITAARLWWGARVREQLAVALREEASKDIHSVHRTGPRKVKRMEAGGGGSSRKQQEGPLSPPGPNPPQFEAHTSTSSQSAGKVCQPSTHSTGLMCPRGLFTPSAYRSHMAGLVL